MWTGEPASRPGWRGTGSGPPAAGSGATLVPPEAARDGPGAPTAVAVAAGRIAAVGADDEILELAGRRARRIHLNGRRLLPGFHDNHTHFLQGGLELAGVQLRDAASREEFIRRITAHAAERPGEWVTGGGWNHEAWGGELPHRKWIDPHTRETPVLVLRHDQHTGLANARALERAGIGVRTPDPPGGRIVRDADGWPTGVLMDAALELVRRIVPPPTPAQWDTALQAATAVALAHGVTTVTDMGTLHGWQGLEAYRRARRADRLPLRVYAAVPIADWRRMAEWVKRQGRGKGRLRWGAVKGFVDGSLGAGTAWFHEPFADEPANAGLPVCDLEELREQIRAADAVGLQAIVHAIGDRAVDWLLDAFAAAREANGPRDRRFRMEHAQHLRPVAIPRFAAEGVIASAQPYHLVDDGRWAERRIGPERARTTYAFRDLLDAGASLTFGSDWTVAPLDPLQGIHAAVTRRTAGGRHAAGWVPEQRITVAEALTAYTTANARASFLEAHTGALRSGLTADLVALSHDILTEPPEIIQETRVDLTVIGGAVAYRSAGL